MCRDGEVAVTRRALSNLFVSCSGSLLALVVGISACVEAPKNVAGSVEKSGATDAYGRAVTARCVRTGGTGVTSCSGVESGVLPAGIVAPGDIVGGQSGWGADDIAGAYDVPTLLPTKSVMGLLVSGNNPNLESDLQVYRAQYGLPVCTVASGCLTIASATDPMPPASYDDVAESSLMLQAASATCPKCKLVVIVSSSDPTRGPTLAELGTAASTAVTKGATVLVTSYNAPEVDQDGQPWAPAYEKVFTLPDEVTLFAGVGSGGYADHGTPAAYVGLPAAYPEVTAVGGTTLTQVTEDVSARRWTEAVWPQSVSGCSVSQKIPQFQTSSADCAARTVVDTAASADPFLTYFTYVDPGNPASVAGWHSEGGTGESAAIVAGVFAATGQDFHADPQYSYANPAAFYDVTTGTNGACPAASSLCNAEEGFDGASGNGSPNGQELEGTFMIINPADAIIEANKSGGAIIQTTGAWAGSCTSVGWYLTGLPAGVHEVGFVANPRRPGGLGPGSPLLPPSWNLLLTADLDAPPLNGSRIEVAGNCDGTIHTGSFVLDVVACTPLACSISSGGFAMGICGPGIPDGCNGTIDCPDVCSGFGICENHECYCPPDICPPP
jgi:hypothetical protein